MDTIRRSEKKYYNRHRDENLFPEKVHPEVKRFILRRLKTWRPKLIFEFCQGEISLEQLEKWHENPNDDINTEEQIKNETIDASEELRYKFVKSKQFTPAISSAVSVYSPELKSEVCEYLKSHRVSDTYAKYNQTIPRGTLVRWKLDGYDIKRTALTDAYFSGVKYNWIKEKGSSIKNMFRRQF